MSCNFILIKLCLFLSQDGTRHKFDNRLLNELSYSPSRPFCDTKTWKGVFYLYSFRRRNCGGIKSLLARTLLTLASKVDCLVTRMQDQARQQNIFGLLQANLGAAFEGVGNRVYFAGVYHNERYQQQHEIGLS